MATWQQIIKGLKLMYDDFEQRHPWLELGLRALWLPPMLLASGYFIIANDAAKLVKQALHKPEPIRIWNEGYVIELNSQAYEEGKDAWRCFIRSQGNPYLYDTVEHLSWDRGWHDIDIENWGVHHGGTTRNSAEYAWKEYVDYDLVRRSLNFS